jgi:hypothetical protein
MSPGLGGLKKTAKYLIEICFLGEICYRLGQGQRFPIVVALLLERRERSNDKFLYLLA